VSARNRVYHNPFAIYPLDRGIFRHPSVFQVWQENGEARAEQRDGQLLTRFLFTAVPTGTLSGKIPKPSDTDSHG
jgi:hypothetical protein